MIVIEGPDASGKSTLASFLGQAMHRPIQHSEGPPKHAGEMNERLARYDLLPRTTIFDRHPVVSEDIYAHVLQRPFDVDPIWTNRFYQADPLIIYCDPMGIWPDSSHHALKEHDTHEHVQQVYDHFDLITSAYRAWAFDHASIIYRIGDNMDRVLHFVTDFTGDIAEFHERFDLTYNDCPRYLPEDMRRFRLQFMIEELCEYAGVPELTKKLVQSAMIEHMGDTPLEDQFDALIDLQYVLLGTSYLHGFPFKEGWARVHRANMTKVRCARAQDSTRDAKFDVIKPPDFQAPVLRDLLR